MAYSNINFTGNLGTLDKKVSPLWTINLEDDETFLEWAKDAFEALKESHRERTLRDLMHKDFYMGMQSSYVNRDRIPRDKEGRPLDKFSRVTINQCYELIEQWVSKMTRYAPAIAVLPSSQEYNDRMAAELCGNFIDYLFYVNDVDDMLETVARACRIDGEVFVFVEWDKDKGDYVQGYSELESVGVRIPVVDAEGNTVVNEKGEPLYQDKAQRVGDVKYTVVERKYIILQPKQQYKEVEWLIKISSVNIDELKADYPDKASEIEDRGGVNAMFNFDIFESDKDWNEVLVFDLYHKSTKHLDKGRHIKFIDGVVLENVSLEYSHGELPCVRLTNIDIPNVLHGVSFLEQIILLQVMYNNTASIAYTNLSLGAHLYWMVPAQGNVDLTKLKNGASVIKFNGGMPPTLQQFKTIGAEIFQSLDFFDKAMSRIGAIQQVSRGEPPTGVEAGVALAFFEEQENQRANTDIKKHNAFIKKLARLSLSVAGDYYRPEDGRMIRIVGKNNQFAMKALDVAKLGGAYDIRVQRTTALSESKSGRLSQILALEGRFPGMLPREQIMDMLDLANDQKFYSLTAVAVRAAERENELMSDGQAIPDAESWEELIVHWHAHAKFIQSASFKEDMDDYRKNLFLSHLAGTEFLMWEKSKLPAFGQALMALENFPLVTLPPPPPPAPPMPMEPPPPQASPKEEAPIEEGDGDMNTPDDIDTGEAGNTEEEPIPLASPAPSGATPQTPIMNFYLGGDKKITLERDKNGMLIGGESKSVDPIN